MDIHESIIAMIDAASIHVNNLKFELEESNEFFSSGQYSEKEYESITANTLEQIADIEEASGVLLNFLQVLNRHSRSVKNLEESTSELKTMLNIYS